MTSPKSAETKGFGLYIAVSQCAFYHIWNHDPAGIATEGIQRSPSEPERVLLSSDCRFFTLSNLCGTAERTKKEAPEKEQELLRQKQKEQELVLEAQGRSFRENIAQLQEKLEREKETLLREQERVLEHKMKVSVVGAWQCLTQCCSFS